MIRPRVILLFITVCFLLADGVFAQKEAPAQSGGGLQASNLLNPNVSAIGWFQGEAGRRQGQGTEDQPPAFAMKEAELGFQAVVDPYARADFFASFAGDGAAELEEGYLTWFHLPGDLGLKVGKFRPNFGKFNRIHTPETPFADRPLVHENYFGEEGLVTSGGSLSRQIPNPWIYLNLDAEVGATPSASDVPAFDRVRSKNLLYVGRLGAYQDIAEAANVAVGGSYAYGEAGQEFDAAGSSDTLHNRLYGADITFRWKNPRRAVYRSLFWQTEAMWSRRDGGSRTESHGFFSHLEYQFARRWRAGGRYDYSQFPADGSRHEEGGLGYLTFCPSEFSRASLQGRQVKRADGTLEHLGWLKIVFNIGPHGAHPF